MNTILKNAKTIVLSPPTIRECDIRISEGEIASVASHLKPVRGEETVDLAGKIVMPGFVCSHTHLYSSLSRGMPAPAGAPKNFLEILNKIWWRLDEALDEESIYYSALAGSIESVKFGTTTFIDHHASPNHIRGSLDIIKEAMSRVGVRGILCYETTDRGGVKRRDLGLEENERFLTENTSNSHFRGAIGAHASLTLGDDSLRKLGELAELYDSGVHIHVAEDNVDVLDSEKRYKLALTERLKKFGILRKKSILAHAVHLTQAQFKDVERTGAWLIHNPRSNMNNAVGYAPLNWFGARSSLGTDGFPADLFEEARIGYFRNAESDFRTEFCRLPVMLHTGQKLVSEYFGRPFGTLAEGSPADIVVLDYNPPTPLRTKNLYGHFLFGMTSASVQHVMVDGNWSVWDRQVLGLDERAVMEKAAKVATRLWHKMGRSH